MFLLIHASSNIFHLLTLSFSSIIIALVQRRELDRSRLKQEKSESGLPQTEREPLTAEQLQRLQAVTNCHYIQMVEKVKVTLTSTNKLFSFCAHIFFSFFYIKAGLKKNKEKVIYQGQ